MLVYIWFRFEWIYGLAAVVAVFHDTLITIGLFSLFNKEISLTVVAALLTLVGYSMNDTIVTFDRIRENLKILRREKLDTLINISVNQTLSRTVLTSGLTLLTALSLWIFGGEVLNGFSASRWCGASCSGRIRRCSSPARFCCWATTWWRSGVRRRLRSSLLQPRPSGSAPAGSGVKSPGVKSANPQGRLGRFEETVGQGCRREGRAWVSKAVQ